MFGLLRKSSLFYISHLCTFSLIGLVPSLLGRYGVFVFMSAVVPLWMNSSVLWAERGEQYRFLRILPITGRQVASVKLSLIVASGFVYFTVLSVYILVAGEQGGASLAVNLCTAAVACLVGVLLTFIWQLCIWRYGIPFMTPVILVALGLQFLPVFPLMVSRERQGPIGVNDIQLFQVLSQPLWFLLFLIVFALTLGAVWIWAARVYEQSDPQ